MARKPTGKQQKRAGKRHHIDDYRELVLDGADSDGLADALMALTQETHANRGRLLPEEAPRVKLPRSKAGKPISPQVEATRAARDLREQMRKSGVRERTHYYSAIERAETGEIDRTYSIPSVPRRRRKG